MERLAASVLAQAIVDAGLRGASAEEPRATHPLDRAEARSFLTASAGDWKRARDWWADMASRDSDNIRQWASCKLGLPVGTTTPSSEPLRLFELVEKQLRPRTEPRHPKMLVLQDMMRRPEGVSLTEVMERFGWVKSTAMAGLTSDMRKYGVTGKRGADGRYRLVSLD